MNIDLAIKHVKDEIRLARKSLKELKEYEADYPLAVATDRKMWNALIPQLKTAVQILERASKPKKRKTRS